VKVNEWRQSDMAHLGGKSHKKKGELAGREALPAFLSGERRAIDSRLRVLGGVSVTMQKRNAV